MNSNPWRREGRPLAIAHRGHSIAYPENTLEAYRQAIALGVDMIECDVNLTRDGVLVMIHDSTLDRTTDGTGRVRDASLDEVQRLDAGGKFKPEFAGERVPTAEAAIQLFREAGLYGCFEVKGGDAETAKAIAAQLADLLVSTRTLDTNFMSSYSHPALAVARAKAPELMIAPERLPDDAPPDAPEAVRQARALGAPVLQYQHTVMTAEVVSALHEAGVAVWAWNTEDEASLRHSLAAGADGLMGDDVRLIVETVRKLEGS
jgi:glycerophosphoryl diester phosphodiesterase